MSSPWHFIPKDIPPPFPLPCLLQSPVPMLDNLPAFCFKGGMLCGLPQGGPPSPLSYLFAMDYPHATERARKAPGIFHNLLGNRKMWLESWQEWSNQEPDPLHLSPGDDDDDFDDEEFDEEEFDDEDEDDFDLDDEDDDFDDELDDLDDDAEDDFDLFEEEEE